MPDAVTRQFRITQAATRQLAKQRKLALHGSSSDVAPTRPVSRQPAAAHIRRYARRQNRKDKGPALMDGIARMREGYVSAGSQRRSHPRPSHPRKFRNRSQVEPALIVPVGARSNLRRTHSTRAVLTPNMPRFGLQCDDINAPPLPQISTGAAFSGAEARSDGTKGNLAIFESSHGQENQTDNLIVPHMARREKGLLRIPQKPLNSKWCCERGLNS